MMSTALLLGVIIANFNLKSPDFQRNGLIPKECSCLGKDTSPELKWQGAPLKTKSFALTVMDPDAKGGPLVHWVIYNIPSTLDHLASDVEKEGAISRGILQGMNHFGNVGYGGPCPPQYETHSYIFTLYALDTMLPLKPGVSQEELENAMKGHVLKETRLVGHFTR